MLQYVNQTGKFVNVERSRFLTFGERVSCKKCDTARVAADEINHKRYTLCTSIRKCKGRSR